MRFAFIWSLLLCLCLAGDRGSAARAQTSAEASTAYGYLGVAIVPVNDLLAASLGMTEARGALVHDVQDGSPAAKAGLKPQDVVLQFDGVDVGESADLGTLVSESRPQHKASLTVLRRGKALHLTAVLGARPSLTNTEPLARISLPAAGFFMPDMPSPALRWQSHRIGLEYEGVDSQLADFFGVKQGVLIRFVLPHSASDRAGLKAGDVLVKFNGKELEGARELAVCLQEAVLPKNIPVDIVRDHKRRSLVVPLVFGDGY
jgi:serine protease Do